MLKKIVGTTVFWIFLVILQVCKAAVSAGRLLIIPGFGCQDSSWLPERLNCGGSKTADAEVKHQQEIFSFLVNHRSYDAKHDFKKRYDIKRYNDLLSVEHSSVKV